MTGEHRRTWVGRLKFSRRRAIWLVLAALVVAVPLLGRARWVPPASDRHEVSDSGRGVLSMPEESERQRFAKAMKQIKHDDTKEKVLTLLGEPDEIRRSSWSYSTIESGTLQTVTRDEWCYGTDGPGSLATLGTVFLDDGEVAHRLGEHGQPPPPSVISESELCAGMRFLHPGPKQIGANDPLHLIRVTNYLQPLGKGEALAIIGEYSRVSHQIPNMWLFLLLRTLFDVPQPPGMPDLGLGVLVPEPPDDRTRIPRFPIVIVDDIPFSLLRGFICGGAIEPVWVHVEYFRKHGTIRPRKLHPPDDPYPSFKKLLARAHVAEKLHTGYARRQVLALGRTAYDPPEARETAVPPHFPDDNYNRHHKAFLDTGARWDEGLQMYVRGDGTHGEVGQFRYYTGS